MIEWAVPLGGLSLPGHIELEIICTSPGRKAPRQHRAPDAELALDSWTAR